MATVTIPAQVPPLPVMTSLPAGAADLATDLRAALVNVNDVQDWAYRASADAFQGDAAEASEHALTRFARRLDTSEAALEQAVLATSRFEDRLVALHTQWLTLDGDRTGTNAAIDDLRIAVQAATEADAPELQRRAERLQARAARLRADIADWAVRYDEAEADLVAALAAVDTVREGRGAAGDPGRVDPAAVLAGMPARRVPARVAAWWRSLTAAERAALVAAYPALIGNLGGVPADARDAANRAAVGADVDELTARQDKGEPLTAAERDRLANAEAVQDVLDDYREQLDPLTGEPLARLTQYQPDEHTGDGGVALFLGDPDHADHVSVYVPGTLSETGNLDSTINNVDALYDAAHDRGSAAVGFWLDYDAPSIDGVSPAEVWDLASVVTPGEAAEGGRDLADYLDGLRASDAGAPAHLSLVGHSYGATTSAHAALDGAPVDELVLLGSPGSPTSTADALTGAEVWVGSADHDPITLLGSSGTLPGPLGHDPAQAAYGGHRFEVDAGSYRVQDLLDNHSSYFQDESLDNITDIVTGRDPDLVEGRHPGGYQALDELLVGSSLTSGGEWVWGVGEDLVTGVRDSVEGLGEGLMGLPDLFRPGR
ncbi:alpha/beta hydrolase [Nocardioides sp. J54]|uniref:alpha/beta hydrolase n=1 Tax=Nocardioides sp. J54 TaxID=935866 RepID=UPI00048D4224|nr:alpha/beta hydrolase [Nocardioides sp. J54]